jgi:hypothetical protein
MFDRAASSWTSPRRGGKVRKVELPQPSKVNTGRLGDRDAGRAVPAGFAAVQAA